MQCIATSDKPSVLLRRGEMEAAACTPRGASQAQSGISNTQMGQSRGRAFVRCHLPVHLQDLLHSLGECAAAARLLEDVVLSLWRELTVPAASGENASPEAVLFWNCVRREKPALADEVS